MSADVLTDSCIAAIERGEYSLVVINYANPDMVGHTGVMTAATEAIQTVDHCIGRLLDAVGRMGGTLLITADHGNAELMEGPDGQAWTAHTTNPVPVILVEGEKRNWPAWATPFAYARTEGLQTLLPPCFRSWASRNPRPCQIHIDRSDRDSVAVERQTPSAGLIHPHLT